MKSRTSFFERSIFLRGLKHTAPVWALYLLALLILPVDLVASWDPASRILSPSLSEQILSYAGGFSSYVAFVYGAVLAWLLHASLFRSVSSNFYAALPLRRTTLFCTRWLTGLILVAAPNLLISLLTLGVTAALGQPCPLECLEFFLASTLGFVFFYSLATLCCMVSGHAAMMPVLYIILNSVFIVVELIVTVLLESFVYGMPQLGHQLFAKCSPIFYMTYTGRYDLSQAYLRAECWRYLLILAGVGLLLSLLALVLFQKREMERSGDVITVRWIRPVFQYAFTLGCALVFCQLVKSLIRISSFSYNFLVVMALLLLGAFLGHIAARMMLTKSVHVFKDGWRSLVICCVLLAAGFGAMRFDLFGYSRYVPDASEIEAVSIQSFSSDAPIYPVGGQDAAEAVTALHRRCIEEHETNGMSMNFIYQLKNGRIIQRRYPIPYGETQPGTLEYAFNEVYNSLPFVLARNIPSGVQTENIQSCTVSYFRDSDASSDPAASASEPAAVPQLHNYEVHTLGSHTAQTFFESCILPDLEDSTLGCSRFPLYSDEFLTQDYDLTLTFTYEKPSDAAYTEREVGSISFDLTTDAKRTIAYLQKLGYINF